MKTDVLKASFLAVLAASLMGATIYYASVQFLNEDHRSPFVLDAFTSNGGQGSTVVSNPFLYDQKVSIYALLKDKSDNPLTNTSIALQINGPPNPYDNVTIERTIATNASGVAMVILDVPFNQTYPETVIGVWSVVATAQIANGEQIADTLAFEVEQPIPYIDLYTDRGGQGANVPSQSYKPGENVTLYALVNDGINSAGYSVSFIAFNKNPSSIAPVITRVDSTNASGIAFPRFGDRDYSFALSTVLEWSVGTWQVLATVEIKERLYTDELFFECS